MMFVDSATWFWSDWGLRISVPCQLIGVRPPGSPVRDTAAALGVPAACGSTNGRWGPSSGLSTRTKYLPLSLSTSGGAPARTLSLSLSPPALATAPSPGSQIRRGGWLPATTSSSPSPGAQTRRGGRSPRSDPASRRRSLSSGRAPLSLSLSLPPPPPRGARPPALRCDQAGESAPVGAPIALLAESEEVPLALALAKAEELSNGQPQQAPPAPTEDAAAAPPPPPAPSALSVTKAVAAAEDLRLGEGRRKYASRSASSPKCMLRLRRLLELAKTQCRTNFRYALPFA
ncbi:predicted GPI-anchored protein 58 [Miscanthus floridulus]|uniref:predicted GPI-anchored protein 58 n=1 Tax=Miscanthus floridulus TaxID=154761 RepID=UPI003459A793